MPFTYKGLHFWKLISYIPVIFFLFRVLRPTRKKFVDKQSTETRSILGGGGFGFSRFFLWALAFSSISADVMTFKAFHKDLTERSERLRLFDLPKPMSYTCMHAELKLELTAIGRQYNYTHMITCILLVSDLI